MRETQRPGLHVAVSRAPAPPMHLRRYDVQGGDGFLAQVEGFILPTTAGSLLLLATCLLPCLLLSFLSARPPSSPFTPLTFLLTRVRNAFHSLPAWFTAVKLLNLRLT